MQRGTGSLVFADLRWLRRDILPNATSGTYRGITMFEPPGLPPAPMDLVSAANAQQEGLFYLPSRNVTLNSSSGITSKKVTLVAWTATFNSSATWEVDPVPQEDLRMYDNHVALVQ
jgi:hypothetical protein